MSRKSLATRTDFATNTYILTYKQSWPLCLNSLFQSPTGKTLARKNPLNNTTQNAFLSDETIAIIFTATKATHNTRITLAKVKKPSVRINTTQQLLMRHPLKQSQTKENATQPNSSTDAPLQNNTFHYSSEVSSQNLNPQAIKEATQARDAIQHKVLLHSHFLSKVHIKNC